LVKDGWSAKKDTGINTDITSVIEIIAQISLIAERVALADLFIQFSVNGLDDDNGIVDDNTIESWQINMLIEKPNICKKKLDCGMETRYLQE
jgi:hypothetical protein